LHDITILPSVTRRLVRITLFRTRCIKSLLIILGLPPL
jgi:hypothetical protein